MGKKLNSWESGERGKELKVPHHASTAAVCDGNLPYIIANCLYSQQPIKKIKLKLDYILKKYYKFIKL